MAKIMGHPHWRRSSGDMDLTVACVPTGIKIGVSTVLWAVEKETALAADAPSAPIKRKDSLSNIQVTSYK